MAFLPTRGRCCTPIPVCEKVSFFLVHNGGSHVSIYQRGDGSAWPGTGLVREPGATPPGRRDRRSEM